MAEQLNAALLSEGDGPAVRVRNAGASSPILLACDHASNRMPASLGTLGLEADALVSHIAWDPGAEAVAVAMAEILDATVVSSAFSRLVFDVNRPPGAEEAIRLVSETVEIPGNRDLDPAALAARADALYHPFHEAIDGILDERIASGTEPVLVTVHSFTPVYFGHTRPVELGIVFDSDARLADAVLKLAPAHTRLAIRANEPYGPKDGVTHTLARHALPRQIPNVMIEIRNDLIRTASDQSRIAGQLAALVGAGLELLTSTSGTKAGRA